MISGWAYVGLLREELWMSSTTIDHVAGKKFLQETWHEEGNTE